MNNRLGPVDPHVEEFLRQDFERQQREHAEWRARRPAEIKAGKAALTRLMPIALSDTGQSRVVARFLLGLYNGPRFPFDLTDLRCLDVQLFEDCLTVLRMDFSPEREVHCYIENGGKVFEQLAEYWDGE